MPSRDRILKLVERGANFGSAVVGGLALLVTVVVAVAVIGRGDGSSPAPFPPSGDVTKPVAKPTDEATAKGITDEFGDELMARYSALGVGVGVEGGRTGGTPDPHEKVFVIVVLVESAGDQPARPQAIKGVPIRFEITGGPIVAQ